MKWHDGEAFTANDVAFTVSRALLNTRKNPQNAWAAVVGVDKVTDPNADRLGREGHRPEHDLADDRGPERRLRQRPDRPVSVHRAPAHPQGHGSKAVETIEFSTTKPIGTGPYKFVKYETDQYSQFEANPDYFMGAPKIKNIFVKRLLGDQAIAQLESGDLDLSVRLNPAEQGRLEKVPTLDVLSTSESGRTART